VVVVPLLLLALIQTTGATTLKGTPVVRRQLITDPSVSRTVEAGGSWSGTDLTTYEITCPTGSHISGFNGRLGNIVDAIGPFNCTNGQTLPLIGGSTGGSPWSHTAGNAGYISLGIRAGVLIDQVSFGGAFGTVVKGGSGGTAKANQTCPSGRVVAGLFGKKTPTNVITIGLICRAPALVCPTKSNYTLKADQNWKGISGTFESQTSPQEAEKQCTANTGCLAWNSYGYIIFKTSAPTNITYLPYKGLCVYVKNTVTPAAVPPTTSKFLWYSNRSGWAAGTDIYASLDLCQNGNGGIRGLTFDKCMDLCLVIPACKVVAFWPNWFDGPSACFSKDANQVPLLVGPTGNTPIVTPDQGAYLGVKK